MRLTPKTAFGMLVAVAFAVSACAEESNPIGLEQSSAEALGAVAETTVTDTVVSILQRNIGLATPIRVSRTIDRSGGQIEIREAGLRVIFPSGALNRKTSITVTALAGTNVAYTFEPHGITFRAAVVVDQSLQGTAAFNNVHILRSAGYFEDETAFHAGGKGQIKEIIPTTMDVLGNKVRFDVRHFSGYLLSIP